MNIFFSLGFWNKYKIIIKQKKKRFFINLSMKLAVKILQLKLKVSLVIKWFLLKKRADNRFNSSEMFSTLDVLLTQILNKIKKNTMDNL